MELNPPVVYGVFTPHDSEYVASISIYDQSVFYKLCDGLAFKLSADIIAKEKLWLSGLSEQQPAPTYIYHRVGVNHWEVLTPNDNSVCYYTFIPHIYNKNDAQTIVDALNRI